jgi:hypothetical protein
VVDLRTGAARPLPAGAVSVAVDAARPRLFLATPLPAVPGILQVTAFDILHGTEQPLVATELCAPIGPPRARYAPAADTLFVHRCTASGAHSEIVAIDLRAASPAPRAVTTVSPFSTFDVSADGTRLFTAEASFGYGPAAIQAHDAATGTAVATALAPFRNMAWDEAGDRLIVGGMAPVFDAIITVFDRDLRPLGAGTFPDVGPCGVRWTVSPHTGRIYIMTGGSDYYGAPDVALSAFAGEPPARVGFAVIPRTVAASCGDPILRTAPGAPRRLRASVAGRDVTLHFENVGGASHFVLEAGFAPGRTDVSLYLGPDSPVTFRGVPSGSYYLRLRGGNEFGGGHPSAELRVVVP